MSGLANALIVAILFRLILYCKRLNEENVEKKEQHIDFIGRPERYPMTTRLFVDMEKELDLSDPSIWILFTDYLTARRKDRDTDAMKRVFTYLQDQNASRMSEGFSKLTTKEITTFLSLYIPLRNTAEMGNFRELADAVEHPMLSLVFGEIEPSEEAMVTELIKPAKVAIARLIHLTGANSWQIRASAERVLAERNKKTVASEATKVLLSPDSPDRFLGAKVLIGLGPDVVDDLEKAIPQADEEGKKFIQMVLSKLSVEDTARKQASKEA